MSASATTTKLPKGMRLEVYRVEIAVNKEGQVSTEALADGSVLVKDCKLNSNVSLNGTMYPDPVLKEANGLYEGAKVYDNHSDDPMGWCFGPRQRGSIMGRIKNVRWPEGGGGNRGDFHVLPSWVKKNLVEDIKADPKAFGFSHVVYCEIADHTTDSGLEIVTKINEVESVDLVSTPATTRGMFESVRRLHGQPAVAIKKNKERPMAGDENDTSSKLIEMLQKQATEQAAQIAKLNLDVTAKATEAAALGATITDLKTKLQAADDRAKAAEGQIRTARVEAALKGLPENVVKALKPGLDAMGTEAALTLIEGVKAVQAPGGLTEPKSEEANRAAGAGGSGTRTEATTPVKGKISNEEFLKAVPKGE